VTTLLWALLFMLIPVWIPLVTAGLGFVYDRVRGS
jgi:hypothetical protein